MKYGKPIKNKKRTDPRYFLEEVMDKDPANINKPLERNSEPPRRVLKEDAVGDKISKLRDEGKPQDQAVAIAKSMEERGELSEEKAENLINEEEFKFDESASLPKTTTGHQTYATPEEARAAASERSKSDYPDFALDPIGYITKRWKGGDTALQRWAGDPRSDMDAAAAKEAWARGVHPTGDETGYGTIRHYGEIPRPPITGELGSGYGPHGAPEQQSRPVHPDMAGSETPYPRERYDFATPEEMAKLGFRYGDPGFGGLDMADIMALPPGHPDRAVVDRLANPSAMDPERVMAQWEYDPALWDPEDYAKFEKMGGTLSPLFFTDLELAQIKKEQGTEDQPGGKISYKNTPTYQKRFLPNLTDKDFPAHIRRKGAPSLATQPPAQSGIRENQNKGIKKKRTYVSESQLNKIIKEETEKLLKENPDMFRGGPKPNEWPSSIGPHEIAPGAKVDTPEFREEFPDWAYMTPSGEFEKPLPNVVDLQRQALVDHEYGQLLKKYPLELFKGDKEMQKTVLRREAEAAYPRN